MNLERLKAALATLNPEADSSSIYYFDCLASTNQTLWTLLETEAPIGSVVIASQQTAGRGQWGRQWQSESGGLYLSKAIAPEFLPSEPAQVTLSSAWGIATILREWEIPVRLKWPNDLILVEEKGFQADFFNRKINGNFPLNQLLHIPNGRLTSTEQSSSKIQNPKSKIELTERKLGGILTETKVYQGQIVKAVIGVGLNWANPTPPTGINLQSFFAHSLFPPKVQSLELLAALVIHGIEQGIRQLSKVGIDALLVSYSELLTCIGRPIQVGEQTGIIVGVTARGELRVQLSAEQVNPQNREIYLQPGTISLGYHSSSSHL